MGGIVRFVKGIFSPDIPQVNYSTMSPTNQLTARDIVADTEAQNPESPALGKDKKRRSGIDSLLVPSEDLYNNTK